MLEMTEENIFIAREHARGLTTTEISKRISDDLGVEITRAAIKGRIDRMKNSGRYDQYVEKDPKEEIAPQDFLDEIEREAGGLFKIGVLDIETTGLWADFGYVLVAIMKDIETNEYQVFRLDETDSYRNAENRKHPEFWRRVDRELLRNFRQEYEKYDIIIHFNGSWFDIKFLNTRLIKNNLPVLPPMKQLDIYSIARYKLRLRSKRLDALKEFLEIDEEESGHQWEYWQMAANGIREGFDFVENHCRKDVDRLGQVTRRMKAYINYIRKT